MDGASTVDADQTVVDSCWAEACCSRRGDAARDHAFWYLQARLRFGMGSSTPSSARRSRLSGGVFVYLSAVLHSRTLLAVSTLALLAYTGWFTSEHFADSIGWPLALIVFGIVMIGLSALAVRIDRDYVRTK